MISKILVIMTVVASISNVSQGSPHHHDDDRIIRLLKDARKQRRYESGRDESYLGSAQSSQYQYPSSPVGSSSGGNRDPPNPILTPGSGSGSNGNFGTIGSSISGNRPSNLPFLPNFPGGQINPTLPPYPIEQVNRGVSTILNGVRSFDLGQILRGAFIFPRNENVKSVANNVIDTIFGAARSAPAGGARI